MGKESLSSTVAQPALFNASRQPHSLALFAFQLQQLFASPAAEDIQCESQLWPQGGGEESGFVRQCAGADAPQESRICPGYDFASVDES